MMIDDFGKSVDSVLVHRYLRGELIYWQERTKYWQASAALGNNDACCRLEEVGVKEAETSDIEEII